MPYRFHTTIRFSQVDAAGILYFSRALEICHEAYEAYLHDLGQPLTQDVGRRRWMLPMVHAEVDFEAPMRLGDRIVVEVEVERFGTTSVTLGFRILGEDGAARAVAKHVHTAVDTETFRPCPLPDEVRTWRSDGR